MSSPPPIIEMEASFSAEERPLETPASRMLDRTMLGLLLALLMFGPLAFGATEPWSVALLQAGSILLGLLWCLRQVLSRAIVVQWHPLFFPCLLFGAVATMQLAVGATAYVHASREEFANYIAYAVILFVTSQMFFYGQRIRLFAEVLTWFGMAVALFAILQSLTSNGMLYWVRTPRFSSSIYGPYANRNHFAGLMEMLVPLGLAVCLSRRSSAGKKLAAGFGILLMSASIFLSGSRGGTGAFLAEMIFFGIIISNLRKKKALGWRALALFAALAAFLVWIDVSPALSRWTTFESDLQTGRAVILRDGLGMFLQKPALGWGLGTFPIVYPQFRTFYTDYYINQAHNDVLQVLVETGICGAAAMFWFIVALYRFALGKLSRRRAASMIDSGALVRLAALTGCTGLLVHSFVDFNLHIPANAAMFFALCALACWGESSSSEMESDVTADSADS